MSDQNLSVHKSNPNLNDVKNENSQESKGDESKTSDDVQDYEVNVELEELRYKIRSEIAKRQQSNIKHNILYIPPAEEISEKEISNELKLLKEKINAIDTSVLCFESIYKNKCETGSGEKISNKHRLLFVVKSLLENKLCITKEILKLTCIEDVLKCKIKFGENLDSIGFDLNVYCNKSVSDNNTQFYRQQLRKVINELNELKNLQTSLDLKIKSLMLDTNISPSDVYFLKYTIEIKNCQCEYQIKHTNHIKEVFSEEIKVKDKFIHIMAQMLEMYNKVLRRNSLITKQMSDSFCKTRTDQK